MFKTINLQAFKFLVFLLKQFDSSPFINIQQEFLKIPENF